ncbi:MAG: DUF2911 domain-containing protein [Saprospiraceae bacterium]
MKKIGFLLILLLALSSNMEAQKSPNSVANGTIDKVDIEIKYCAPSVRGRTVWGGLEKYGKVWRAGANENTTVSFSEKVMIDGKELAAGKYGFFIIPNKKGDWVAIFSKTNDQWGAYSYKQSDDALRVNITPSYIKNIQEQLEYSVGKKSINFSWEYINLSIPISTK